MRRPWLFVLVLTMIEVPTVEAQVASRQQVEPSVDQVVAWALAAESKGQPDLESLLLRARLSALVPNARVGIRRGIGQDLSTNDAGTRFGSDDSLSLFATLNFRLERLLLGPNELQVRSERRATARRRQELINMVVSLYFERRTHQVQVKVGSGDKLAHELRIRELTALLNAFTGGKFRRIIRRR